MEASIRHSNVGGSGARPPIDDDGQRDRAQTIEDDSYSEVVGERLRSIRRQKRLSLQEVESISGQEFKASVLGAYERGERAISVPRLARLAAIYRVPVDQLLPPELDGRTKDSGQSDDGDDSRFRIDLARLESMQGTEAELLSRYVRKIQLERQDFNGRVLSLRRDDLKLISSILGVSDDRAHGRLEEMGLRMHAVTGLGRETGET